MQISAISSVSLSAAPSTLTLPRRNSASAPTTAQEPAPIRTAAEVPDLAGKIYTTRIAGKTYSGDIAYASGLYSISVAGLPGADGRGSSLLAAESALSSRIDILV